MAVIYDNSWNFEVRANVLMLFAPWSRALSLQPI